MTDGSAVAMSLRSANMPFFKKANYVDASGGNFFDIAGDLHFYGRPADPTPGHAFEQLGNERHHPVPDTLRPPTSSPEDLIQRRTLVLEYISQLAIGPNSDNIHRLMANIKLLIDRDDTSWAYKALKPELELLYQISFLSVLGIKSYQYTQLGQSLAQLINPELDRCIVVLQELFFAIDSYRQGLWFTYIRPFWPLVWRSGWEEDELASWRNKLAACRTSLGTCVMALRS